MGNYLRGGLVWLLVLTLPVAAQPSKLEKNYHLVNIVTDHCLPCHLLDSLAKYYLAENDSIHYEAVPYKPQLHGTTTHLPLLRLYKDKQQVWQKEGYQAYQWLQAEFSQKSMNDSLWQTPGSSNEWSQALRQAKRTNRYLLVWLYHPEYDVCQRLFQQLWHNPVYANRLLAYYIPFIIDISREIPSNTLSRQILFRSLPAVYIVDDRERLQHEIIGYLPAHQLSDSLLNSYQNLRNAEVFSYETQFKLAIRKAKTLQRPLVVWLSSKHCEECTALFYKHLQYEALRLWMLENSVVALIDERQIPKRYSLRLIGQRPPLLLVFQPNGYLLRWFEPYSEVSNTLQQLRELSR